MKKNYNFLSIFFVTLLIGYFAVSGWVKRTELTQILTPVEKGAQLAPIINNLKIEQNDESEDFSEEDFNENFKIKLLETGGIFHDGDVEAKNGEIWLGLFKYGNNYFLRNTKIAISRVHDELFDVKKWQKTGKFIRVKEKQKNIFLLKNASQLREGKIETLFQGLKYEDTWDSDLPPEQIMTVLKQGFSKKFQMQGKVYELKKNSFGLVLEGEGKRQVLNGKFDYFEEDGRLYWVGDLDHDYKPDLYLGFGANQQMLYLSSEADKDKLVKKAAIFLISGCGR